MKLVRDNMPSIIDNATFTKLHGNRYYIALQRKLQEELKELKETNYSDAEEFADVIEVLSTLASINGISFADILNAKRNKRESKGGFGKGIYMLSKR